MFSEEESDSVVKDNRFESCFIELEELLIVSEVLISMTEREIV